MPTAPVGVMLSEGRLRLVALRQHPEMDWEIVQALDQPLPPGIMANDEVTDGGGITEFLGRIFEQLGLDPDNVILGIPLPFSALRRGYVAETMPIEMLRAKIAKDEIPSLTFRVDAAGDLVRSVGVLQAGGTRKGMEVVVGVVIKKPLRDLQKAVREAGLVIHAMDHPGLAVYNAFRRTVKVMPAKHILLYVGPNRVMGVETDTVGPTGVRVIEHAGGTDDALRLLDEKMRGGESGEDILFRRNDALTLYGSVLEPWTSALLSAAEQMVTRVLDGGDPSTVTVKLCGDGAQVTGLTRLIAERTGAQCEILNPLIKLAHPRSGATEHPAAFAPFVPALGLALRYMSQDTAR